jgi:fluoride exporter
VADSNDYRRPPFDRRGLDELPVDPDLVEAEAGLQTDFAPRADRTILWTIGLAGVAGALCRYGVSRWLPTPDDGFPWATFWTNTSGSAAIGFVLILLTERFPRARLARPLIATGFLGAFTTFSTYMVDADVLVRDHRVGIAVAYTLLSLVAGVVAVILGVVAARMIVRLEHRLDEQLS